MDSNISLLSKSEILSFLPSAVVAQAGLCQTVSEIPMTSFLASRLKGTDKLRSNCEADMRFSFHYMDSTVLFESKISSL